MDIRYHLTWFKSIWCIWCIWLHSLLIWNAIIYPCPNINKGLTNSCWSSSNIFMLMWLLIHARNSMLFIVKRCQYKRLEGMICITLCWGHSITQLFILATPEYIHLSDKKKQHVHLIQKQKLAYKCCQWLMVITCHQGADEFMGYYWRDSPEPIKESASKRPGDFKVLKWQTQLLTLSKLPVYMLRNNGFGFYSNLTLIVDFTYTLETSVKWRHSWCLFDQHFVST